MDADDADPTAWDDEVQRLLLHGRDLEASEIATRNLRASAPEPTGPIEQLDPLDHTGSQLDPVAPPGPSHHAAATTNSKEGHVMNPNKALWEKGDFTQIAATMRQSGDELVRRIGVTGGSRVLDLGCGDGTTAVPAARRGAEVLGVDIASNLVAAGNRRAAQEGLDNLTFREGDASHLDDLDDEQFDLVVSIFGAMFAPKPFDVAKEMVRVTRPGGRIVMGNWIPGDPTLVAQILKTSSAYAPPPPEGFVSPMTWGIDEQVVERFTAAGLPAEAITLERDTFVFEQAAPPADLLATFRDFYGPTMNAYAAAEADGRVEHLHKELLDLFEEHNTAPTDDQTRIPATFLRVTAHRPA